MRTPQSSSIHSLRNQQTGKRKGFLAVLGLSFRIHRQVPTWTKPHEHESVIDVGVGGSVSVGFSVGFDVATTVIVEVGSGVSGGVPVDT